MSTPTSVQLPILAQYGISPTLGFLSDDAPLLTFIQPQYAPWDRLTGQLPALLESQTIRKKIEALPFIDPSDLQSDLDLRRSYVVLGFLIQAYIWSGPHPNPTVPAQIAEPFLYTCKKLGTEPALSYAGLGLWNWRTRNEEQPPTDGFYELDDIEAIGSFTGTRGEDAFYLVGNLIEAEGGPLIPLLLQAIEASQRHDAGFVTHALETCSLTLERMKKHLAKFYATLNAGKFYHDIRPFLAGGEGMEARGIPDGFLYQYQDGRQKLVKCIGGSAAQSSLFPFLDMVLGIEHQAPIDGSTSIFQTMRSYMPKQHRDFLEVVSSLPSLRPFIESHPDTKLSSAYNECIEAFRQWRGSHIAVVSKYIVRPARAAQTVPREAGSGAVGNGDDEELQGTAGSALIPFLKQARDDTVASKVAAR